MSNYLARSLTLVIALVLLILAGLPIAVWLDLRSLSEHALRDQADELTSMIDRIRAYYTDNIVGRVLANDGKSQVVPNYLDEPGGIPIPATLSLELGEPDQSGNDNVRSRFFSDYPFANRAPHRLRRLRASCARDAAAIPHMARVYDVSVRSSTGASASSRRSSWTPAA